MYSNRKRTYSRALSSARDEHFCLSVAVVIELCRTRLLACFGVASPWAQLDRAHIIRVTVRKKSRVEIIIERTRREKQHTLGSHNWTQQCLFVCLFLLSGFFFFILSGEIRNRARYSVWSHIGDYTHHIKLWMGMVDFVKKIYMTNKQGTTISHHQIVVSMNETESAQQYHLHRAHSKWQTMPIARAGSNTKMRSSFRRAQI